LATGTSGEITIEAGAQPGMPGRPYTFRATGTKGTNVTDKGKLGEKGIARFTFVARALVRFQLKLSVVGAEPEEKEFWTGDACPGGYQTGTFPLNPPTGGGDVHVGFSTSEPPCAHGAPKLRVFTESGQELTLKKPTVDGPHKDITGQTKRRGSAVGRDVTQGA